MTLFVNQDKDSSCGILSAIYMYQATRNKRIAEMKQRTKPALKLLVEDWQKKMWQRSQLLMMLLARMIRRLGFTVF
jgi:hypothetical protein